MKTLVESILGSNGVGIQIKKGNARFPFLLFYSMY